MSKHVECELNDMEHQMNKVIYMCSPSVLVCFTWLLNHVIYIKLRKRLLLLQAEQMRKIALSFTQNGPRQKSKKSEFAQLLPTPNGFSARDKSRDLTVKLSRL